MTEKNQAITPNPLTGASGSWLGLLHRRQGTGCAWGLTGKSEHQLVEAILSGAYDHIFQSRLER